MDDDILDIDEVLTDSFYMPSEECYNDIQNIVQQWKNNESAPINVQNECTRYFDTRTFTRQKKRLNSVTNGLSDLDYQKSVGFPVDNQTSGRHFILDSSPSNSMCSYVSDDATSLITSGDFTNVSYFINNANDLTLHFNELDLKKTDETSSSSPDTSQNSTARRIEFAANTTIVGKSNVPVDITFSPAANDELNHTHTIPIGANRTFEKELKVNSTFEKKLDDTFDEISGKIAHSEFAVPARNLGKYDGFNLVQSTPKVSRIQMTRRSATPPNLSPIPPKKFEKIANDDESNTFIGDMHLDMEGSISNDEQQNSLVNFEEFENSIFLDDKGDEDFETLLDRMGSSKRLENREVMKESLDNIKKRHSLLNLEIKQEHQREKMNNHNSSGDSNKSLVSSLHKSIPDERLLKRSRLFDNITLNTSMDKSDRSLSTSAHLDSNRTFNNQSAHRNDSNHLHDNDNGVCNSTVTVEKSPSPPVEVQPGKLSPEIEDEQPEKYDNRDRFRTIRLSRKPAQNAVVIADAQPQFIEPAPIKKLIAPKHIEPVSRPKSRQISTLSSRDSYLKSSSVENLNTRGFRDVNVAKSSSTQSLDKTSVLPKTSLLKNRSTATAAAVPKNVKPNNVQNVIQKSIPVFNSRTNVNKLTGLVRPSSGYYSFNTEADKFEAVNNAQSSGDSTFVSNNVMINDEPPKPLPSRIAKPSGLRPPSKISCLPRPMSKR